MKTFTKQMWEAAGWTWLETFLVTIGPAIAVIDTGDWHALLATAVSAAMGAAAAALSIIKSNAVKKIGAQDSVFISGNTPADCVPVEEVQG